VCEQVDTRDKLHGIIFDSTVSFSLLLKNVPCEVGTEAEESFEDVNVKI
jgi:hypothetical protein